MVRIIENYTLYEVVGEGAYGKVYRAVNRLDNKQYAVKVIEVKKFQSNKKLEECTVHEINILTNIQKNKHIITYFDMLKTQNNFYFVYQYCNGGTLESMLRKQNTVQQKSALLIFKQLIEAFQVLNKYNIMHRDLKPDNIFFHNGVVKVGDFGFCKSLEKAEMTKTMLGSPIYMAPEILNGQIYSNKADIWSIGVVLYQMLYGYCPFESSSIPKLIQVLKDTELEFPIQIPVSTQTKKLLKHILTKDPQKRIEWMELFQIKISGDGRLQEQVSGKFSLVDQDKGLVRTAREISDGNEEGNPSSPSTSSTAGGSIRGYNSPQIGTNYNNYTSPKNAHQPIYNDLIPSRATQPIQQRMKMGLMKKPSGTVDQGQTIMVSSPIRKIKSGQGIAISNHKQKVLKFHQEIVRGMNIVRSMGLNNEKYTPLFTLFIFKDITEKMKKFKQEQFTLNSTSSQIRQYREIFDLQIDDLNYEIAMIRNKVEDFADWKKAVKAKVNEVKNTRLCYEMVMFLSGEAHSQGASQNQMRYAIRMKIN